MSGIERRRGWHAPGPKKSRLRRPATKAPGMVRLDTCGAGPKSHLYCEEPGSADAKDLAVLRVELGHQSRLPRKVLPHRFPVAGVTIVDKEKIVDAVHVRGRSGGFLGGESRALPVRDSPIQQLD